MTTQEFTLRIVIVAVIGILALILLYHSVIRRVMSQMKYNTRLPLVEVFGAIDLIVANECEQYSQYFANTTDMDFTAMTNSQFINVYNDLCSRILHAFSPGFLEMANMYLTTEEVNNYTARIVYNWMANKIQTIPDTAQDMSDEDADELENESFWV